MSHSVNFLADAIEIQQWELRKVSSTIAPGRYLHSQTILSYGKGVSKEKERGMDTCELVTSLCSSH